MQGPVQARGSVDWPRRQGLTSYYAKQGMAIKIKEYKMFKSYVKRSRCEQTLSEEQSLGHQSQQLQHGISSEHSNNDGRHLQR